MEEYYEEKIKEKQKKKKIQHILIKLIYVFVLPIILYNLAIIIQTIQNPDETPSVFNIKTFCIISGSMEPTIHVNDVVLIKEVTQNEINNGDIISFNSGGDIITHRIINIENAESGMLLYTTKGDANNVEDEEKIIFEDIEGKYVGKIPKIGKIIIALKNKVVLAFVLSLLVCIYIIEQKASIKKIKRNSKRIEYEENKKEE